MLGKGAALAEIYQNRDPYDIDDMPPIVSSANHIVLSEVPNLPNTLPTPIVAGVPHEINHNTVIIIFLCNYCVVWCFKFYCYCRCSLSFVLGSLGFSPAVFGSARNRFDSKISKRCAIVQSECWQVFISGECNQCNGCM